MKLINNVLSRDEIDSLIEESGVYTKLTIDVEKGWVVVGPTLHADGEKILLEKGSMQKNIWGGGINFVDKQIDTTAVLNIRPNLNNDSMEVLDRKIRNKFVGLVKKYFVELWN